MNTLFSEMLVATNLWWIERKDKGAHHFILRLVPLLFQVIESLYTQTRKLPLSPSLGATNKEVGGAYVITIGMFLPSDEYTTLRVILSLMGDIYNLLTPLKQKNQLMELAPFMQQLYYTANSFRKIRNFFTHLDAVLTDMDIHGITGAINTNCGLVLQSLANFVNHIEILDNCQQIHILHCFLY
jgi:hypothetical protein